MSTRWGAYGGWNLSEGGFCCHPMSEPVIGPRNEMPAQPGLTAGTKKRPQQDSNLRSRLRRPMLYPLSYGGSVTWERVPVNRPCADTTW